jgi:integrase
MATICPRRNKLGKLIGWQAKIRKLGYPPLSKTFDSKEDAENWATVKEAEMVRGVYVDRSKAERSTLGQVIEDYVAYVAPTHKGGDAEVLRLKRFLREETALCAYAMANLETHHFEDYRDRRLAEVSAGTVKRELGLLHAVIEGVRKRYRMVENPVSDVRRPQVNDARDVRLHGDEAGLLLEACENARTPWLFPAVLLALETAMRRGELLSLTWDNIDLEAPAAYLPDTKTGKARAVPLSSLAIATLEALPRAATGRVIATTAEGLKQAFERARKRAGLDHVNFHDLRHEATSRLFERGWGVMEVATVTGHQDLQMLKRYTNLRARDLARKMG